MIRSRLDTPLAATTSSRPTASIRGALAIVFLNSYAGTAINFASTLVLARLISPVETGLFSVATSVVLLAQAIRDFGVGEFLIQERDLTPHKIRTAFGITLILAWSLGLLVFLSHNWVAAIYKTPELSPLIAIASGSFFVAPFSSTVLALLNRHMQFGILLRISLASILANAIVSIALALDHMGATALTCGMLAMNVTTAVVAMLSTQSWHHFAPSLREWRALSSFSIYVSSANIINQVAVRVPDLIIGRFLGYEPLGIYNRASGLVATVHQIVVGAVQTVAFPAFAAAHRAGENVKQPYLRAVTLLTGAALPLLALFAIVSNPMVWCLLGQNWLGAATLIPPLAFSYAIGLIAPMVSTFLSATGNVRLIPRIAVGLQLSLLAIIAITVNFSIKWVAIGTILYGVLNLLINAHYLRQAANISLPELFHAIRKSLWVTVLSGLPAFAVTCLPALAGRPELTLLTALAAGGVGWCGAVVLLQHPIVKELRLLLHEVFRTLRQRRRSA